MPNRRQFYEAVSAAVADIIEHGFDNQERLDRWIAELRRAATEALIPQAQIHEYLREALEKTFHRTISPSALARRHKDVSAFTIEQIQPRLRAELNRRILTSANLITLDQKASIERTLQRFAGWASSVPAGGSAIANRRETAESVRRSIAGLPFEQRRVVIDQGHKLAASINDILATDGGAIAMQWQHIVPGAHYDSRPEHLARDGKVFLIRDSWAHKDGLVKLAGHQYLDQIDQPGEAIFCSCSGVYLYSLSALPSEMLTEKGHAALKGAAQDTAPNVGQLIRAGHCDLRSPPCH